MLLGFITDSHLGINRLANTTVDSRRRFRNVLYLATLRGIQILRDQMVDKIVHAGDLFDTFANNELTIAQGAEVVSLVDVVLGGNHDIKNDVETLGSLQMLRGLPKYDAGKKIIIGPGNEPYYEIREQVDGTQLCFVPHAFNQEIFDSSLSRAIGACNTNSPRILVTHCNVGIPGEGMKTVTSESTSLYLSDEKRKLLENYFDMIFVGHEHPYRNVGAQTVVIGNTMPLTFGEMGGRRVLTYDTKKKELRSYSLFNEKEEFIVLQASAVLEYGPDQLILPTHFVDIQGTIKHTDVPKMSKAVASLWKNNSDVLMMRNNATIIGTAKAERDNSPSFIPRTLPELIGDAVRETPHKAAYDETVAAVEEDRARTAPRRGPTDGNY